jgi:hypothetical protein
MQCTHLVEEISTLGIEEPLGEVVPQTAQRMNAGAVSQLSQELVEKDDSSELPTLGNPCL